MGKGILFIGSLALASSDGGWFPWLNVLGLLGLGLFAYFARKEEKEWTR